MTDVLTYEDFIGLTNGLTNQVSERFCKIYQTLASSDSAIPMAMIQKELGFTRNHVGYLLGAKGFPDSPVNVFFEQQRISGFWHLSPVGKQVRDYVSTFSTIIETNQDRAPKVEPQSINISKKRLDFYEDAHEEATKDLEKKYGERINQLEMENAKLKALPASGAIESSLTVKDERELLRAFVAIVRANKEELRTYMKQEGVQETIKGRPTLSNKRDAIDFAFKSMLHFIYAVFEVNGFADNNKEE